MGFLDTIAETARRRATGDDWYVENLPYCLEIQATGLAISELGFPFVYIQLPLAPENYRITRQMRQSVTPTLGGLIAEERGILWWDIDVRGNFGLQAKPTIDTSRKPEPPPGLGPALLASAGLSGPGWTKRMVRNYFEKYAELKADPTFGSLVRMIWHDFKTDDHYIVVPESIEISRSSQKRMIYPYAMRFKGIGKPEFVSPIGKSLSNLSGFGKLKNAVSNINSALALANSAVQEGSAILGEVRYFADGIESCVSKITDITRSAQDFVDGVTDTMSIGRVFILDAATQLEEQMALIEGIDAIPDSVRQNYMTALDALYAIAAQRSAFGKTYAQEAAEINFSEKGAARTSQENRDAATALGPANTTADFDSRVVRTTDTDLLEAGAVSGGRSFADYTSFMTYAIKSTDTLTSIAARYLKDGARWYDLAIINGLKPPYISETGAPGTVSVGDVISVPSLSGRGENAVVAGEGENPGLDLLGTDFGLMQDPNSIPGRPLVDLAVDKRTYKDAMVISGIDNLVQAIQLRTWTEQGSMPLIPDYGLPRAIGVNMTGQARLRLYEQALRSTILKDSRVSSIGATRFTLTEDLLEVDMDVIPVGFDTAQAVSTSLV